MNFDIEPNAKEKLHINQNSRRCQLNRARSEERKVKTIRPFLFDSVDCDTLRCHSAEPNPMFTTDSTENIINMHCTEYRAAFKWHQPDSNHGQSIKMRNTRVANLLLWNDHNTTQLHSNGNTEYQKNFRPFSLYLYETGKGWQRNEHERVDPIKQNDWYNEVCERNRLASELRARAQGRTVFGSEDESETDNRLNRRNLAALALATTTHRVSEKRPINSIVSPRKDRLNKRAIKKIRKCTTSGSSSEKSDEKIWLKPVKKSVQQCENKGNILSVDVCAQKNPIESGLIDGVVRTTALLSPDEINPCPIAAEQFIFELIDSNQQLLWQEGEMAAENEAIKACARQLTEDE